jgi:hypothetical protein
MPCTFNGKRPAAGVMVRSSRCETLLRFSAAAALVAAACSLLGRAGSPLAAAAEEESPLAPASVASSSFRTIEGGMTVELSDDYRVTLLGEATSRAAVIATICEMAGIGLLEYSAGGGGYLGKLENVSIEEAFRRILRSENYVLGVRAGDAAGARRVTWIRVFGEEADVARAMGTLVAPLLPSAPADESSVAGEPPTEAKPGVPFSLPASVLMPAFSSANDEARRRAQKALLARLEATETTVQAFSAADISFLAEQIRRYRNPLNGLAELQALSRDPAVQAKLGEIFSAIRVLDGQPPPAP